MKNKLDKLMIDEAIMSIEDLTTRNYIIDLIMRDTAKKPIYKDGQLLCETCGTELSIRGDYGYPYCRCGQCIDWSD